MTHSQEPYTPKTIRSSASAATRCSLTILVSNPEVRTGREKKRLETGFSEVQIQNLLLNHALKDQPTTACRGSSPQLFSRSFWHLLLSASTPVVQDVQSVEVWKLQNGHWKSNSLKKVCQRHHRRNVTRGMTQTFVSYVCTTHMP